MNFKEFNPENEYDDMTEELYNYVIARDGGLCQLLGIHGSEVHHVVYRSRGGRNKANNLILLSGKAHVMHHSGIDRKDNQYYLDRIKKNEERFRRNLV